ncbi:MAG: FAD-dependent oxidoreductase [Desulfobacterales bacterium]|nr:MAG: FAD-dependent oxidoreductase [Desulfobacterales bacterium]
MKDQARAVIIGGGITGCCILYHLAQAGWSDVTLVEKDEITSGATCHAMGLLTQFNASPTMMRLRRYSAQMYARLGAYAKVGSLRVASSKEQHRTLLREVSQAKGVGLDVAVITPQEARAIMPWMSVKEVHSAVYLPADGHLDPHGATHAVAKAAKKLGATIQTQTRVTGIEVSPRGAVTRVKTNRGDVRTEIVINAAGLWGAQVAAMVGAAIPSTPVVHQHAGLAAVPGHEVPAGGPCFRDIDYWIYGRPEHGGMLVGGWELNPPSIWEDGVPWSHSGATVPDDLDRFEPLLENAIKRFPFLAEAGLERLIAHPDAFTPDAQPLLGPWPGVQGFWLACGLSMNGFGGAGGIGKALAQWIIEGSTEVDLHGYHAWRFGRNFRDPAYAAACARQCYRYYYYTRYPHDEDTALRPRRISPFHYRLQDLGAVFGQKNGWERVNYVMRGEPWRRAGEEQRAYGGWVKPPYFEELAAEHRAFREGVGMVDLTSFGKIEFKGPGALPLLQRLAVSNMDQPAGAVIYTQFCNPQGGVRADVTITRLADDHFRLITGAGFIDNDLGYIQSNRADDDQPVEIRDVTEEYACLALWGPKAREVLQAATADDVSHPALPYMQARTITVNGVRVLAQRISYVGELGWELYAASHRAIIVWDRLWEAGQAVGLIVGGYKVLGSLRIEKGYVYYSSDLTTLDNPYAAGLGFTVDLENGGDFIGREALQKIKKDGIQTKLCAITIGGADWLPLYGGEAVIAGGKVITRLRSADYGHTVQRNIGLAYLPSGLAQEGTPLEIEIFGARAAARVGPRVAYDPQGAALQG